MVFASLNLRPASPSDTAVTVPRDFVAFMSLPIAADSRFSKRRLVPRWGYLMALDWSLRKDLCAVLLAFGHGEFGYEYLKEGAFENAGDHDARWFLDAAPEPDERLREALAFAKPGSLATAPRTLTERGVAEFILSLFAGDPVNLQSALRSLVRTRAALVSDYMAGRLEDSATELVREFFGQSDPQAPA